MSLERRSGRARRALMVRLMLVWAWVGSWGFGQSAPRAPAEAPQSRAGEVLVVVGAPGNADYAARFDRQVQTWKQAAERAGLPVRVLGETETAAASLQVALAEAVAEPEGSLWLVLIGHGTFDGRDARFNLRGPDVGPTQLAEWLKPLRRELVFVHTGSASAGFLRSLAGPNRLLISATKSADEVFYARFGEFFAPAIAGASQADLDQDRQVSVLEAFLHASREVAQFYAQEERIATEHALIDDNGDGVGTRAEAFEGLRLKQSSTERTAPPPEGRRAAQVALVLSREEEQLDDVRRAKRDALERQVQELRDRRGSLEEARYFQELEALMRELAGLYAR